AIPTLERGLEGCATWEFPLWAPWFASRLGAAYVLAGRLADALPLLEPSMEQAEAEGWKADAAMLAARLGEGYLAAGRIDDASGCAMRALDLAVKHQNRGHQGWVLRLLGEVASRRADVEHAAAHSRGALAVANQLGMRPLAAHCHLDLARVCRRTGQ